MRGVLCEWPLAVVVLAVILGCLRTVTYAARWNDRLSFYSTSLREQPRSVQLGMLLGMELRQRHDLKQAAEVLARTREENPDYWKVWYLSAQVALERGDADEAERLLWQASKLDVTRTAPLPLWQEIKAKRHSPATRAAP